LIFIRTNYAERLQLLDESWKIANDKGSNADKFGSSSMEGKKANEHEDTKTGKAEGGEEGEKSKSEHVAPERSHDVQRDVSIQRGCDGIWQKYVDE